MEAVRARHDFPALWSFLNGHSLSAEATQASQVTEVVLLCCLLLVVCLLTAYVTKLYQFIYLTESGCAMLLGMAAGALAKFFRVDEDLQFHPEVFFYGFLPLIIFQAGYSLKKKDFFRNFTTITLFAVVGTIVSALVYGLAMYLLYLAGYIKHISAKAPLLECLMFGSLISAIDPVATLSVFQDVAAPSLLYNLVFGESLVNDASSIVLFRTFASFMDQDFSMSTIAYALFWFCIISIFSIVLGVVISLLFALLLKQINHGVEQSKFQLAFILLSAYVSYAVAEIMSLSGIMSLFFCGICNGHYAYYNTSHSSQISSKYAFGALAFLAEIFVFAWCGMQVVVLKHQVDWGLLLSAIPLCLLSRAVNIFPLSWLANKGRSRPIPFNMKIMMWMCGLRGAVAYALAANMPTGNRALETTTLFIVVSTTLIFGGLTGPLLQLLDLTPLVGTERTASLEVPLLGDIAIADILNQEPANSGDPNGVHGIFKYVDATYLKPLFGGRKDVNDMDHEDDDERGTGFLTHIGEGFVLHFPSDWIPAETNSIEPLIKYACPETTSLGFHVADLVLYHSHCSSVGIEALGEPIPFIQLMWKRIGIGALTESEFTRTLKGSESTRTPKTATASARRDNAPAFITSVDTPRDALQNTTYRYELVVNPSGSTRFGGETQHALVTATVQEGTRNLFVCKVQGFNSWWERGGRSIARQIIDKLETE